MSVICLGETLIDLIAAQPGLPLERVTDWTPYPGGAPTNVACGLVKLGTPATLISCLGRDDVGKNLVALLTEIGVDTSGLQYHPTAPTRQIYVTRSIDGDRTFAGFIDNLPADRFADAFLDASHIAEILFTHAQVLAIGTISLASPVSASATYKALELARKHHLQIFIDVNWRSMFWDSTDRAKSIIHEVLNRADFIKMSDDESQWLYESLDPSVIRARLPNSQGVFVTAGAAGCHYSLASHNGFVPSFDVPAIDTTGAGDSFVAGCIHQLCQPESEDINDARTAAYLVKYASAAGALTTLKPGAIDAQPTNAAVLEFLSANSN